MGLIVLLLVGGFLVVKASAPASSAAPDEVSAGADFPSTGGGHRDVKGGAMSTQQPPAVSPVGSGGGFGFVPAPNPIAPTVSPPPSTLAAQPLATVQAQTTQALRSALPTVYSGITLTTKSAPSTSPTPTTSTGSGTFGTRTSAK